MTPSEKYCCVVEIHPSSASNEARDVTSNTKRTPSAPRKNGDVIDRNLSCPEVSQICKVAVREPSSVTWCERKSTPIVGVIDSSLRNFFSHSVHSTDVLPTPLSPTKISFSNTGRFELIDECGWWRTATHCDSDVDDDEDIDDDGDVGW